MGCTDFIKSLKLREWINIGFFFVSLAMLIAGSVMLAIAIASIPPMPYFDPGTTTAAPVLQPNVIFTSSMAPGVTWNDNLSNSSSPEFKALSSSLQQNISTAWTQAGTKYQMQLASVPPPLSTQMNEFTKGANGVNFYMQLVFSDSSVSTSSVSNSLSAIGYSTDAFTSSTGQCSSLVPPTQKTTLSPSGSTFSANPVTVVTTTKTPTKQGAYCDASSAVLTNIFLVDVSDPIIGTLDDKLAKISSFLINAPLMVNLDQQNSWSSQEFRLVAYGGNEATPLGRASNPQSWNTIVGYLNSTIVNPSKKDGHELTDALRFIFNNYRSTPGVAGNIIVIGDGFDFDGAASAFTVASALKNSYYYSLGFIMMTTSQAIQNAVLPLATDYNHFYPIDSVDYLNNEAVKTTQALWTCGAFYPTAAPPTPPPTRLPLITTTPSVTQPATRSTASPLLPLIASCQQNVLYLIDQSPTMRLNGYNTGIQYAIKSATSLANLNSLTTFAFVIYNDVIVAESDGYTDLNTFSQNIQNAPQLAGGSDIQVGFTEAQKFIKTKSSYNNDSVRSLLYFITDGNDFGGNAPKVVSTTQSIRSELQTEVIGIDLVETSSSKSNVQQAIQFGVYDGYVQSVYVGVGTPSGILDDQLLNSTNYQLQCKDHSNCYTGLTFVIETSQAEGDNYVDTQIRSVLKLLAHYKGSISPVQISVSLVYFSSPDNLTPNQPGQSGILFEQVTDGSKAINLLNTTSFTPLGPASDLQLGFSYTLNSLKNGFLQNSNLVIFFARGDYEKLSNCCPDPTNDAAAVRQLATVQGVVIGPYSSKPQLDSLTGSSSIDANSIIGNLTLDSTANRDLAAQKIAENISPIIDSFIKNQYCPGIPQIVDPPCEDPIDVLILLHANDRTNWTRIVNFTSSQLIPDLLGTTGALSSKPLTTATPINFAILSYYYLDVITHADFTYLRSKDDYVSLVNSLPFQETKGTATLSLAYKKAVEIFTEGRQYASKNLIVITDTMDISDMEDAFSEHDAMVQQVGGNTTALTINTDDIPGADKQINVDSFQLDSQNKYSVRQIANSLTLNTCFYNPKLAPTAAPVSPSPTLPGPIPVVKARNVWPDITILIDTSISQDNAMTDILFEKVRSFLDILLNQFSVGEKGSRFTIATFDGETVEYSCRFFEVNNYYDLSSCRNERLLFDSRPHQNYRNVAKALQTIRTTVYENSTSGYRGLNENFLVLLTLGSSSTSAAQEISKIQRKGIRTVSIGLSNNMTNIDLSSLAQTAFMVQNWNSVGNGIDTNYDLADRIFQLTTKKRSPSTSNFYANLVFIVDTSSNTRADYANIVQYVSDFVTPYLVGSTKTQVSIVPFADNVLSALPLTSSQDDVDRYLSSWSTSSSSTSSSANIGNAIQYVSNMIGNPTDKPTHVVFVVGATNVTGSELSKQLLGQYQLYVANYNLSRASDFKNLVYSANNVFSVSTSQSLLNRVVSMDVSNPNPINSLTTDVFANQEGFDQVNFPTAAVAADIVFLLDETGLNDTDFSIMKQFLSDFTQKFSVGSESTQFALQSYNGRTIPHDGFHLYESTSNSVVVQRIQQLTLAKATENSTDADLAGAIEQELFFFLTEQNGWRDDLTTYTIILSHADSFYERDTVTALGVKNVSSVFALGLNGPVPDYVKNYTNTGFYEYLSSVSLLNVNSAVVEDLLTVIRNDYKKVIYPTTYPIGSIVKADFIFLIDSALGSNFNSKVQTFLLNFTSNVGTFSSSGNDTKLAVVSYGSKVSTEWNLQSPMDIDSIRSRISNFQITTSTGSSNLKSAIDTVILDEAAFGVNSNRPTYMIVIAGSSTIQPQIDKSTSRHLNTRYSTFVIQTNFDNNIFSYAPQVLGTQLTSDRVAIDGNLQWGSTGMNNLSPWISNEFSAWQITFPNK